MAMRWITVAALLVGCTLTACVSRTMEFDNIRQVKVGMTEAELLAIMGKPKITRQRGDTQVWGWTNPLAVSGASIVTFGLKDGRVTEVPNTAPLE